MIDAYALLANLITLAIIIYVYKSTKRMEQQTTEMLKRQKQINADMERIMSYYSLRDERRKTIVGGAGAEELGRLIAGITDTDTDFGKPRSNTDVKRDEEKCRGCEASWLQPQHKQKGWIWNDPVMGWTNCKMCNANGHIARAKV